MKKRKIRKVEKKIKKIEKKTKKKKNKLKKEERITVDYCCNSQWNVYGKTVISLHSLV